MISPLPRVFNIRDADASGAVYIGRGSCWGNRFVIGRDGTRDEVCDKLDAWAMDKARAGLRKRARQELKGRDLVCFCAPKRCHGLTWLRIANEEDLVG